MSQDGRAKAGAAVWWSGCLQVSLEAVFQSREHVALGLAGTHHPARSLVRLSVSWNYAQDDGPTKHLPALSRANVSVLAATEDAIPSLRWLSMS